MTDAPTETTPAEEPSTEAVPETTDRWRWAWALAIGAVTFGAFALFVHNLDHKSIWVDEGSTITFVKMPWSEMWRGLAYEEGALGFYYIVLRPWIALGDSVFMIRLLSALFATASIPLLYAVGARVWSREAGLTAAVLLAINAFFVQYAQEARPYALAVFLVVAATYLFVRANQDGARLWWGAYGLVGAMAVYAHLHSSFVMAAHGVALFLLPRTRTRVLPALASYVTMGVLLIPMALFTMSGDKGQIDWIPKPTKPFIRFTYLKITGSLVPESEHVGVLDNGLAIAYGVALVAVLLIALVVVVRSGRSLRVWGAMFAALAFLFVFGGSIAASSYKHIFFPRYLIVALPAMALAGGIVLALLQRWWLIVPVLVVLGTWSAPVIERHFETPKEPWRDMAAALEERADETDAAIFITPTARRPFEYYVDRSGHEQWPEPIFPAGEWGTYPLTLRPFRMRAKPVVNRALEHPRVWLVARHGFARPTLRFLDELKRHCGMPTEVLVDGRVRLFTNCT